ncbi:MAG: TRAP transporter substrate-binding protein, partial [Woeseiaceae bacterium]
MLTKTATLVLASLFLAVDVQADSVVIKSGNVIGSPLPGNMAHHMHQTQHDFARLVSFETNGEVTFEILEGKRPDIPVFAMPGMTQEGTVIQATAVPSFFLPKAHELKIFEIPYLFDDAAHAQRYPASDVASDFSTLIEDRYDVKVLGHFLVAHNVAITSTNRLMILPQDFAGRYINDDFESFAPMWENIKPARRYSIGYTEAVDGALHDEQLLDTSIGMLQNIYAQKQYTKFHFATVAPSFYTFFYTFILNRNVWDGLNETQQAGVLRAARAAEDLAFVNEQATATYHRALNRSLGITMHEQTPA